MDELHFAINKAITRTKIEKTPRFGCTTEQGQCQAMRFKTVSRMDAAVEPPGKGSRRVLNCIA